MVTLGALWLPIVLSAVLVFILSAIVHMVLRYHASDYSKLPNEDGVRAAIRTGNPGPAQYIIPYCATPKEMESPEMKQKYAEGPIAVMNLKAPGYQGMGPMLLQWFVFTLVVSFFVAYVAAHTVPPGTAYLEVFRVLGAIGFAIALLVAKALSGIFGVALYRYAIDGQPVGGFTAEELESAVKPKGGRNAPPTATPGTV